MDSSLVLLRRSVLLAVGLSLAACRPVIAEIVTDTADTATPSSCEGDVAIVGPDGQATGFVRCADGVVLRVAAATDVSTKIEEARCTADDGSCSSDADCRELAVGACLDRGIQIPYCTCVYACSQDSDCGTDQICLPPGVWEGGPAWGTCVAASCTTNADCPSEECSFTAWNDGCQDVVHLGCRTPEDACRTDAECASSGIEGAQCAFDYTGTMTCVGPNCDIGRPFTDDAGEWRRAPLVARTDWCGPVARIAAELTAADRARLVAHWADVAALEHASIASFARHTLELLALGAPAALVADVQRATADEVRHAELAFGMVVALGGDALGPGALDIDGMVPRNTPESVLRAVLIEGCMGETFGAAEAALAASRAEGAVREVLDTIAADEARHAVLAWRTVRWLLDVDPSLRSVLDEVVAPPAEPPETANPLAAHGILSDTERAALHRRVWETVVQPALAGLRADRRTDAAESGVLRV